jgi:flagellar biosynthesis/type III secretory pathway protein FliH
MGLLQRSRDEGLQEGIQLGKQEGIEQGWQESLLENIELILEIKFGAAGLELLPEIRQIQSVDTLRAIQKRIKTADNTEAVRDIYRQS